MAFIAYWWIWLQSYDAFPHWIDAPALWGLQLDDSLYADPVGAPGAFLYSPLVAQLLAPFGTVSFEVFYAIPSAANLVALTWMLGPVLALVSLIFFPPIAAEIGTGNINLLLGAAIVLSFRQSGWWSVPLLTKVTPGVGVLWYAFRQEWRPFAIAVGATAGLAALSFAVAPDLWLAWFGRLSQSSGSDPRGLFFEMPLAARAALSVGLVWLAARLDRPALVVCACVLALPVIWGNALAMLAAVPKLLRHGETALAIPIGGESVAIPVATETDQGAASRHARTTVSL